jgi:OOP family OmpA-OmpF porin
LETGKQIGHLKSNPQDGSYFVVLPLGRNYGIYAKKDGYYPITKNIDLRDDKGFFYGIYEDIILYSLKNLGGSSIRINNVFFDYDKSNLKPESYPDLDRLVELLNSIPEFTVEIAGHTDYIGSDEYNQDLSERRAKAVVNYLVKKGISRDRLKPIGYGKTKPVANNETDEGRALNRRVEFKVIPKK